jgi:hypothetical protein
MQLTTMAKHQRRDPICFFGRIVWHNMQCTAIKRVPCSFVQSYFYLAQYAVHCSPTNVFKNNFQPGAKLPFEIYIHFENSNLNSKAIFGLHMQFTAIFELERSVYWIDSLFVQYSMQILGQNRPTNVRVARLLDLSFSSFPMTPCSSLGAASSHAGLSDERPDTATNGQIVPRVVGEVVTGIAFQTVSASAKS